MWGGENGGKKVWSKRKERAGRRETGERIEEEKRERGREKSWDKGSRGEGKGEQRR